MAIAYQPHPRRQRNGVGGRSHLSGGAPTDQGDGVATAEQNTDSNATVYGGEAQQLSIAQQVLNEHVTSSTTGRCGACGAPGPCFRRETAMAVFSRSRWLPRRIPGLSQPERLGLRRVDLAEAALRVGRTRLGGVPGV
jgi:hypothetical protein